MVKTLVWGNFLSLWLIWTKEGLNWIARSSWLFQGSGREMLKQHTILLGIRWDLELSIWEITAIPGEKAMAPHSSTLEWKIPWMEEPGGLQSMGSLRVRHDRATSLSCIGEGNGNPLQCSCLENPRDGGAWWAAVSGVAQSRTRLKRLSSSSSRQRKWAVYGYDQVFLKMKLLDIVHPF